MRALLRKGHDREGLWRRRELGGRGLPRQFPAGGGQGAGGVGGGEGRGEGVGVGEFGARARELAGGVHGDARWGGGAGLEAPEKDL